LRLIADANRFYLSHFGGVLPDGEVSAFAPADPMPAQHLPPLRNPCLFRRILDILCVQKDDTVVRHTWKFSMEELVRRRLYPTNVTDELPQRSVGGATPFWIIRDFHIAGPSNKAGGAERRNCVS
jgi:hypothetical protein